MKKTSLKNKVHADALPFDFESTEFDLEGWGEGDFYCRSGEILVFLEVEKSQNHPNTNVLKYWPFLDEHPDQKVLLIQMIIKGKKKISPNRIKLCKFMGKKLETLLQERFKYHFMIWNEDKLKSEVNQINEKLRLLQ